MIPGVHRGFAIDSLKSRWVYSALGFYYYRSSSLQYSSSGQSKTRYAAISSTSLYLYNRVTIPGTFFSNRNALSPTFPVLTCISRELSCLRSPWCRARALYYGSSYAPGRGVVRLRRLSGESAVALQLHYLCLHCSTSTFFILWSPAQLAAQYALPLPYSSE